MFNPSLLSSIKNEYSQNEQRIILRAIIQNPIVESLLNQEKFQKYFQAAETHPITFFQPAYLALNLLGLDNKLMDRLFIEPLQPVESNLLRKATDVYQRVLLQKGFQEGFGDAFLISLFLREQFIKTKTWKGISEKIIIGEDGVSNDSKLFWDLVLACLNNIIPDSSKLLGQLLIEKPTQTAISSVIHSVLMNPSYDDELQNAILKILIQQKLETNINFLVILNQYGLSDVTKDVAISLISSSPRLCVGLEEINKSIQTLNWINADDLAQKIQHIAILNAFAGNQEKANDLIDRVKTILAKQSSSLGTIQRELKGNIDSISDQDGNIYTISPEPIIKKKEIKRTELNESLNGDENNFFNISPYKKVKLLISDSRYFEAEEELERINYLKKTDPIFFSLSAEINLQLGGFQEAENALLIAQFLSNSDQSVQRLLSRIYFLNGEYSKAFNTANSLFESQKDVSDEDIYDLCNYALKSNKPEFVLKTFEEKYSLDKSSSKVLLLMAESNFQMNKMLSALDYLRKAIDLDKYNPQIWLLLAKIETVNKENEKALEALITAKRYAPNSQEICFELSKRYFDCGNKTAYEEMISEMIKMPLESVSLTNTIIQFLRKNSDVHNILDLLNRAINKWPKNIELTILLAEVLNEKKSYVKSIGLLDPLYKKNQLNSQGLCIYILSIMRCNLSIFPINAELSDQDLQIVSELISQLSEIAPDDSWTKIIQAEFLHRQKKSSEAFEIYRNLLLEKSKTNTDLLWRIQVGMGQILIEIGHADTAMALLSEALDQSPSIFEIFQFIAESYRKMGMEEKAMKIAYQAMETFLVNPCFYQWYAKFLTSSSKKETALQHLKEKANTIQGENGFLLIEAYVELELGNKNNVEKILNEVVKQNHLIPAHLQMISTIYARIGDFPRAITILTISLKGEVNDQKIIKLQLAGLFRSHNNFHETEKVLLEAFDSNDEIYLQKLLLAETYFNFKNLEKLKTVMNDLVKEFEKTKLPVDLINNGIENSDYYFPDYWKWFLQSEENMNIFIAKCLFLIGDFNSSLEFAEKALNYNPMNLALLEFSAELASYLLLDLKADQLTKVEYDPAKGKIEDFNHYLGLICLRAEIGLDRCEDIYAASLVTNLLQGNEENPRMQCLQARLLYRQGDFENAAKFYEKAKEKICNYEMENSIRIMPKTPAIWYLEAAKGMGDLKEVFNFLSDLVESNQIMPKVGLTYLKARIELEVMEGQADDLMVRNIHLGKSQKLKDFDPIIEKAIISYKDNYPAINRWYSLYKLILGFEDDERNIQEEADIIPFLSYWYRKSNNIVGLDTLIQKYPDNPETHFQIGQVLMSTNPAESEKQLREAIALNSHNPCFYAALAILYNRVSNFQNALQAIEQGLILWPNESNWHFFAANMAEKSGDLKKEINHLEKVKEIDPQNINARKRLISAYYQNKKIGEAARLIKEKNNKGNESFEELVILAKAALAEKNYKESFDYASKASQLDNKSSTPYSVLSELALRSNNLDKASEYSQRAIECDPENIDAYVGMAKIIGAKKDKNSALNYLETILKKGMKSPLLLCEISLLKKELFGTKYATEFLINYQNENDEMILGQLALFETELKNFNDAEKFALASLLMNPFQADLKKILGQINKQNGNLDQAVKYYAEAIQCDSNNSQRYIDASEIYFYRREVVKALEILEQGIMKIKNDWRLFHRAGKIYWEMKDYLNAESMLRQASNLNPNDQQLKQQLSTLTAMNIIHQKHEVRS